MSGEYKVTRSQRVEYGIRINNGPIDFATLATMIEDAQLRIKTLGYQPNQVECRVVSRGNCEYLTLVINQVDQSDLVEVVR